jgi:glycoside/pentoside/hexuronide:cation symporter, GPH family
MHMSDHDRAADPGASLPLPRKIEWGTGGFAEAMMAGGIMTLALQIYNVGLGVPAVWLGWILAAPRIFDALLDPMQGNWSDNTRTRWGRRKPWIVGGALVCATMFILSMIPPTTVSQPVILIYFTVTSVLYYLGYSTYAISYNALGLEITDNYNDRTKLWAWRFFFISAAGIVIGFLYKACLWFGPGGVVNNFITGRLPFLAWPEETVARLKPEVLGVRYVVVMAGIIMFVSALLPLRCREKPEIQKQPIVGFFDAIRLTFSNKPFMIYTFMILTSLLGLSMVGPFGFYLNLYYVCAGNKDFVGTLAGFGAVIGTALGFGAIPFTTWVSNLIGKRNGLFLGQALIILGYLSSWVLFTPTYPYLSLIPGLIVGVGMTFFQILYGSMLADVCDLDELECGMRREGQFSATNSFITKIAYASTVIFTGYLLAVAGVDEKADTQTADAVLRLRLLYMAIPIAFVIAGALIASRFPITAKKARAVRALLDERRRAAALARADEPAT